MKGWSVFFSLALFLIPTFSLARTDEWFFGDEAWTDGIEAGIAYLGHLGSGTDTIGPDGGYFFRAEYALWYNHFIEGHLDAFYSVSSPSFYGAGGGLRLNALEFSKANALEFAGENTLGLRCVETRRGLFSFLLRSLLVHLDLEGSTFFFSNASGTAYDGVQPAVLWGGGVQWGPNIRIPGISRLYIDTSVMFTRIVGVEYFIPYLALGGNF